MLDMLKQSKVSVFSKLGDICPRESLCAGLSHSTPYDGIAVCACAAMLSMRAALDLLRYCSLLLYVYMVMREVIYFLREVMHSTSYELAWRDVIVLRREILLSCADSIGSAPSAMEQAHHARTRIPTRIGEGGQSLGGHHTI